MAKPCNEDGGLEALREIARLSYAHPDTAEKAVQIATRALMDYDARAALASYPALPSQEHGPAQGLGGDQIVAAMLAAHERMAKAAENSLERFTHEQALEAFEDLSEGDKAKAYRFADMVAEELNGSSAKPATPEPSSTGRLGRNETSSAGEGEKLREALGAMLAHYGPPDSVAALCDYPAEHPITLARQALASPAQPAVVPGGEGER